MTDTPTTVFRQAAADLRRDPEYKHSFELAIADLFDAAAGSCMRGLLSELALKAARAYREEPGDSSGEPCGDGVTAPILPIDPGALEAAAQLAESFVADRWSKEMYAAETRDDPLAAAAVERFVSAIRLLVLDYRHHRPTQWAYDAACAALDAQRRRADTLEAELAVAHSLHIDYHAVRPLIDPDRHTPAATRAYLMANGFTLDTTGFIAPDGSYWTLGDRGSVFLLEDQTYADWPAKTVGLVISLAHILQTGELGVLAGIAAATEPKEN